MKTTSLAVSACIILCTLSCGISSEKEAAIRTTIITEKQEFEFNQHFSDLEVIELTGDYLIGQIGWVGKANNRIFVYDSQLGDIKVFNDDFEFLESFSRRGQAPGEYKNIDNIFVNENGIYIFSNHQASVFKYNFDYEFEEKIPIEFYSFTVELVGDRMISYQNFSKYSSPDYNLKTLNMQGKVLKRIREINIDLDHGPGYSGGITKDLLSNIVYFSPPMSDSVFKYSENLELVGNIVIKNLFPNQLPDGIYTEGFTAEMRKTHGRIVSLSPCFYEYIIVKYQSDRYLRTAVIDLKEERFARISLRDNKSYNTYLIDNPSFIDEDGWVYSFTGPLFYRGHSFFKDLLKSQGIDEEKAESEDFKFLIRFKVKRDQDL
jgi:hypothetical protein